MQTILQELADFVVDLKYNTIPEDVRNNVKNCVMDAIGNGLGGLDVIETRQLRSALLQYDQTPQATIWGIGNKVSVPNAAFINAVAHEGMDFTAAGADAALETNTIPAAIAVAEKEKVDGKSLITAITAGFEIQWRAAMAIDSKGKAFKQRGFYISGVSGPFGSAAACSKILNLDKKQTTMALGLAASQALGIMLPFAEGVRTKVIYSGRAAETGVKSAYQAKEGVISPIRMFEAEIGGFLSSFSDTSKMDKATWKLGTEFMTRYLCYKLYPCCRYIHPFIDAAFELRDKIKLEDITKMVGRGIKEYIGYIVRDERPKDAMDAQFNVSWTVAAALINGKIDLDTWSDENLRDPKIWELAQKFEYIADPDVEKRFSYTDLPPFTVPADLTIWTREGKEYTASIDQPRGIAPTTYEDLYAKFEHQATKILPLNKVHEIANSCRNLDQLKDTSELVNLTIQP